MPLVEADPCITCKELIKKARDALQEEERNSGVGAINPAMAKCYADYGKVYFECELYYDGLENLKISLGIYLDYLKEDAGKSIQVAEVYTSIGNTYVEMERYGKAMPNFYNATDIYRAASGNQTKLEGHAETLYYTAEALRKQCSLQSALDYNLQAVSMLVDVYGARANKEKLALSYYYLGCTLRDRCQFEQADKHLRTANTMLKHLYAEHFLEDPSNMNIFNTANLFIARGEIQEMIGNFSQARYRYEHANIACKTFWGDDDETSHVFYAKIFDKVGGLSLVKSKTDDAHTDFGEAYALRCEFYDDEPNHAAIARSYILFGHGHRDRFEYELAISHYEHALDIYEVIYNDHTPPCHPNIARCKNHIGLVYLANARYTKALEMHNDALFMLKEFFGESTNHPDIANTYQQIAEIYYTQGNFDMSHEFNHKSLTMNRALHKGQVDHLSIVKNLYDYGRTYLGQGELHQALQYLTKAMTVINCIFSADVNLQIVVDIRCTLGDLYFQRREMEQALTSYVSAMQVAQNLYATDSHPSIAACCKLVGDLFTSTRNFTEAINYYTSAISMYDEYHQRENMVTEGNRHPGKAITMLSLAKCHAEQNDFVSARNMLDGTQLVILATFKTADHPLRADMDKLRGDVHSNLGESKKALECYGESLAIRQKIYGKDSKHLSIAESYYCIGMEQEKLSEVQNSLENLKRALEIREYVHFNQKHLDQASTYNGLGRSHLELGHKKEAKQYFEKALDITKELYKPKHLESAEVANAYSDLGQFFCAIEEYDNSIKHHQEALEIYQRIRDHRSEAMTQDDIGLVQMHAGNFDDAIDTLRRSLNLKEEICQRAQEQLSGYSRRGKAPAKNISPEVEQIKRAHNPEIAISYSYIGNVLLADAKSPHHGEPNSQERFDKYEEAFKSYEKSLALLYEVYGDDGQHTDIADCLSNLGIALQSEALQFQRTNCGHGEDNWEEALNYHNKALAMWTNLHGTVNPNADIAHSYHNIGKCYNHRGEFEEAIRYYENSLEELIKLYGRTSNNLAIGLVYASLGTTYYEAGLFDKAREKYEKSHTIIHPAHHKIEQNVLEVAASYRNLANVYENLGRHSDAQKAKEIATKIINERVGLDENVAEQKRCLIQ
ncbi:tetratricopeptide repeat protein 28-like [Watersipora subatra]|uniref:tetratricopeptide repeat protein 28-like n=1 Tax=Watersipora subatra TaxID=2589382 RepID=UPI00355C7EFA